MMRAGQDLVVEERIQKALEARQAIRAAVRGQRAVLKIAPIAIDNGKIAEDFAGRQHETGAQFARAALETKNPGFATAAAAVGFGWHGVETAAFLVFVDLAAEELGQRGGE